MAVHLLRIAVIAGLAFLPAMQAAGGEHKVVQAYRGFKPETLTVKAGEKVVFANEDYYDHNVYAEGPNAFNIGIQAPGESHELTFNEKGEIMVLCRIHPKMKMVITVTE